MERHAVEKAGILPLPVLVANGNSLILAIHHQVWVLGPHGSDQAVFALFRGGIPSWGCSLQGKLPSMWSSCAQCPDLAQGRATVDTLPRQPGVFQVTAVPGYLFSKSRLPGNLVGGCLNWQRTC